MRHNNKGQKLGRKTAHRLSMLSNMVTSLITHERINTTLPKAKEARRLAEKLITLGKTTDKAKSLHARRQVFAIVQDESIVKKVFDVLGPRFASRPGGYTRILKTGFRHGDNAAMSVLELVERTAKAEAPVAEPKEEPKAEEKPAES